MCDTATSLSYALRGHELVFVVLVVLRKLHRAAILAIFQFLINLIVLRFGHVRLNGRDRAILDTASIIIVRNLLSCEISLVVMGEVTKDLLSILLLVKPLLVVPEDTFELIIELLACTLRQSEGAQVLLDMLTWPVLNRGNLLWSLITETVEVTVIPARSGATEDFIFSSLLTLLNRESCVVFR